jgi:hypothetical protein
MSATYEKLHAPDSPVAWPVITAPVEKRSSVAFMPRLFSTKRVRESFALGWSRLALRTCNTRTTHSAPRSTEKEVPRHGTTTFP